jgi:hypothetical protein
MTSNSQITTSQITNSMDDIDDNVAFSTKDIENEAKEVSKTMKEKAAAGKNQQTSQLFRRKSDLPPDMATLSALDKHKRNQEFLPTTLDDSNQSAMTPTHPTSKHTAIKTNGTSSSSSTTTTTANDIQKTTKTTK